MALETEIARYNELLPELLASGEGKYAVICGRDLVGVFDTNDAAYRAGLDRVGVNPFLLRQVLRVQPRIWIPTLWTTKSA
jgi:hypothetical protein